RQLPPIAQQPGLRALTQESFLQCAHMLAANPRRLPDGTHHAFGLLGEMKLLLPEDSTWIGEPGPESLQALTIGEDLALDGLAEPTGRRLQRKLQIAQHRRQSLGGGAGSGSAKVRNEIGDGEIHLVADRRYHRDRACVDRSGNKLLIEG